MVNAYLNVIDQPNEVINDQIFNVGFENYTLDEIGSLVQKSLGEDIIVEHKDTDDERSYHISSDKISRILDFKPLFSIEKAINDLKEAFDKKLLKDSFDDPKYFNIKMMQKINLQ